MNNTYSQLGQDLDVIKHYNFKENGFFVEIGANDGISLSNTYLLEKKYNWKGLCIEPLPILYEKLKENRNCHICNNAVFNKSYEILKFSVNGLFSGITEYIDRHIFAKNGEQINVITITLDDALMNINAPKFIEYLSIDTEGSEFEILKTINFRKYRFGIIHVEHNYVEPRRTEIRDLLESNGYVYKKANYFDDEYINIYLL
jgi:FkbM family methyltransferase